MFNAEVDTERWVAIEGEEIAAEDMNMELADRPMTFFSILTLLPTLNFSLLSEWDEVAQPGGAAAFWLKRRSYTGPRAACRNRLSTI